MLFCVFVNSVKSSIKWDACHCRHRHCCRVFDFFAATGHISYVLRNTFLSVFAIYLFHELVGISLLHHSCAHRDRSVQLNRLDLIEKPTAKNRNNRVWIDSWNHTRIKSLIVLYGDAYAMFSSAVGLDYRFQWLSSLFSHMFFCAARVYI